MICRNIFVELLEVSCGVLSIACAPVKENPQCQGLWEYQQLRHGWGCVLPLTPQFSEKACLTRGFHLALDRTGVKQGDLICIKDETDRHCTHDSSSEKPHSDIDHMTSTVQTTTIQIDQSEKKEGIEPGDTKIDLARAMGCCMEGLSPEG